MLEIHLFGQTEVRTGDGRVLGLGDFGGIKPREIFEILVLHRGRVLTKEALADLLWEGAPPDDAIATLESYISVLRKKVTPGVPARGSAIGTVNGGYRLDPAQVRVDLDEVDALLKTAESRDPEAALTLIRRALQLARDEVLEHVPYARWAEDVRQTWTARIARAAVAAATTALDLGDEERALSLARRALRADVLAEDAWRLVMRAHWRAGRRAEALRAYESCRRRLTEALGVEPCGETRELFTTLLQSEADPEAAESSAELNRAVTAVINLLTHADDPERVRPAAGSPEDDARLILDLLRRTGVPVHPVPAALRIPRPRTEAPAREQQA